MTSTHRRLVTFGCVFVLGIGSAARAAAADSVQAGEGNAVIAERNGLLAGTFAYQLVVGQFYEWNTDPTAVPGILSELARRTPMKAAVDFKSVGLDDPQMLRNPVLIMTGNRVFRLSKEEIANLRNYLRHGGFLYADDCGGADWSFRRMIKEILPDAEMKPLASDHPVFKEFYTIQDIPKVVDLYGGPAEAFGVVQDGRLAVVYTHDTDLPCAWEQYPNGTYVHVIEEGKREDALRFGVNVILHALRQDLGGPSAPVHASVERAALPPPTPLPAGAVVCYPMRRQLPSTHITAIAPGRDYVWFGGFSFLPGDDEGMARYEKSTGHWRVFMDAEGILSEEINCLALRGEKVLVGSDTWKWTKGMATFDPATGRWSTFSTEQGLPHDRVVAVLNDEDRLWVACRQGIAVLDRGRGGGEATRRPTPEQRPRTPSTRFRERVEDDDLREMPAFSGESLRQEIPAPDTEQIRVTVITDPAFPEAGPFMIGLMKGGPFVWANHFAGVARFDKRRGRWTDLSKQTPLLPRNAIDMACDTRAAWFLSPVEDHVKMVRFDLGSEVFSEWKVPDEVDLDKAVSLATDGTGLLIGMQDNLGIYALALSDGSLVHHWMLPGVARDRSLRVARMVFDEGAVWAALWPNGGLWRRNADAQDWREIPYRAGSPASHILSLTRIGNALYVGTMGVGVWRYDLKLRSWFNLNLGLYINDHLYHYLGDHDAIRWENIYAMAPDGRRVWMATNHGLIMHDPDRTPSGFEVIEEKAGIIKGVAVAGGLVWTGGDNGKVRAYDPVVRAWKEDLSWTAPSSVRSLCLWRNALWAATARGLCRRTLGAGGWTEATVIPAAADLQGLWPAEAALWITSRDALYVLRDAGQPAAEIQQARAWAPIHCVHPVGNGTLMATDRGLVACDTSNNPTAFYNRDSGLDTPATGALEADNRYIWLGTLGGGLTRIERAALWPLKESRDALTEF